ncbi:MAG: universal stress protein [Deltaproteobacteria bacterium]|nr:universal stress protein [Deltaproteobacteria bacterium]
MKKVMLILSTSRTSTEAVNFAVKKAKALGGGLLALYIIESELTDELFDRFTDIGFIGDKPSTELTMAVQKEYRQRGYEEVGRVQVLAMEEGIDFDALTIDGDFTKVALQVIDERDIGLVVAVKRKLSFLKRYFSRSVVDELTESATCEVVVFEEDAEV